MAVSPETTVAGSLASLAAQKNDFAFYLTGPFKQAGVDAQVKELFTSAGRTKDLGRSCLHFSSVDDLDLDILGEVVEALPVERYIELHEKVKLPKKK